MEMFICYDYKLVFFCWKVIYLKSDLQEIGLGVVREDVRGTFKGCLRKRFLTPSWSTFIQFVWKYICQLHSWNFSYRVPHFIHCPSCSPFCSAQNPGGTDHWVALLIFLVLPPCFSHPAAVCNFHYHHLITILSLVSLEWTDCLTDCFLHSFILYPFSMRLLSARHKIEFRPSGISPSSGRNRHVNEHFK